MLNPALSALLACTADEPDPALEPDTATTDTTAPDTGEDSQSPPVELTDTLCEDASLMEVILEAMNSSTGSGPTYGTVNIEQAQRMIAAPTEGPFYMVNLIRYREHAKYADGRETDLTGREANALYSPVDFLEAIGARIVFASTVRETTLGEAGTWEDVAIVEYPCPIALFAMSVHPEFIERSEHKDAGVEASIVMVTHLGALPDITAGESPYPSTEEDPALELVQVLAVQDSAAMAEHDAAVAGVQAKLGITPTARLAVEGVFIGDGREWDEVRIDFVPSGAALEALAADPAVVEALPHQEAALEDAYGLAVDALVSAVPTE